MTGHNSTDRATGRSVRRERTAQKSAVNEIISQIYQLPTYHKLVDLTTWKVLSCDVNVEDDSIRINFHSETKYITFFQGRAAENWPATGTAITTWIQRIQVAIAPQTAKSQTMRMTLEIMAPERKCLKYSITGNRSQILSFETRLTNTEDAMKLEVLS